MKTLISLFAFFLFTMTIYSQNTEINKDEHAKSKKEIDKILESPSNDTLMEGNNKDNIIPEEESDSKKEIEQPLDAPSPQKGVFNVKSEPVPGAEIIIDNIPPKKDKKNKNKSTQNNTPLNQENKSEKSIDKPKNE
ncbi:MAG: hypothetical protein HPY79_05510 [Bacteroidales bacterium]|nr:hypothetical protein [Bacteroidales bacterium]